MFDLEPVGPDDNAHKEGVNQRPGLRRGGRRIGWRLRRGGTINRSMNGSRLGSRLEPSMTSALVGRSFLDCRPQRVNDRGLKGGRRQSMTGGSLPIACLHRRGRDVVTITHALLDREARRQSLAGFGEDLA